MGGASDPFLDKSQLHRLTRGLVSLTIKAVMKEETQSTAPLPPQPTKMGADKQEEEENKEELKLKEKPKPQEGALVVVDHPVKKGGTCGTLGPGLFDLFLRLGFLKVQSFVANRGLKIVNK